MFPTTVTSTTEIPQAESNIHDEPSETVLEDDQVLRDVNNSDIYIRRVIKSHESKTAHKKTNDRVYNSVHACVYCGKLYTHIRPHLLRKHSKQETIETILKSIDKDFVNDTYDKLRASGDDAHNCKVITNGAGELILSRRPVQTFQSQNYGPCPKCREWMMKNSIHRHQVKCKSPDQTKVSKKNLLLQSNILSGRFKSTASKLLCDEVFSSMTNDDISEIAKNDLLIVMLGESWLRRNISNKLKRKHYTSGRMRLAAKLLQELRRTGGDDPEPISDQPTGATSATSTQAVSTTITSDATIHNSMWNYLTVTHFDNVVQAALQVALPDIEDEEELKSPSNAIKLKYDILRLVNAKWAYIVKNGGTAKEAEACKNFLEVMKIEWSDKVTRLARNVLAERKLLDYSQDLIPDPEDMSKLTIHLKSELSAVLERKDFRYIVMYTQTRLLIYNKRRSGEVDGVS